MQYSDEELLKDEIDEFHSHRDEIALESRGRHGNDSDVDYEDDFEPVMDIKRKHRDDEYEEEEEDAQDDDDDDDDDESNSEV